MPLRTEENTTLKIRDALRALLSMRIEIYGHLTRCFYGIFDPCRMREEVQTLLAYGEVLGDEGEDLKLAAERYRIAVGEPARDITSLEFEYNRLFVGPARLVAPPYESVYTTQELLVMGEPTVEVRKAFREAGLQMRNLLREPEDHIATELEFLVTLQERCLGALEENNDAKVHENIGLQRAFLDRHPAAWVPLFCRAIKDGSGSDFFKALAVLLERFLVADVEVLKWIGQAVNDASSSKACYSQSKK